MKLLPRLALMGTFFYVRKALAEKTNVKECLNQWINSISMRDPAITTSLYSPEAVLIGTFADDLAIGQDAIYSYFTGLFKKKGLRAEILSLYIQEKENIASGLYKFIHEDGEAIARYSFVFKGDKIMNHHSSLLP